MTTKKQQTQTSTEVTPTETDSGKAISANLEIQNTYLCGWCMTGYHKTCRGDLAVDNGKVYQCECTCEEANIQRGSGDKFRNPTDTVDGTTSKRGNNRTK
jgi:hypothetical protein